MDEILIDEKKYVSSKQAAKMTGYAKDYIGQLCREGRVPARLVGRSWYVLASAIQDHRFGTTDTESREAASAVVSAPALPWTKEPPRYETFSDEPLPTINRLKNDRVEPSNESVETHAPANLQDSWKEWFDRIGNTVGDVTKTAPQATPDEPRPEVERYAEEPVAPEANEEEEVNIPIHTIYQAPPEELLPHYVQNKQVERLEDDMVEGEAAKRRQVTTGAVKVIKVTAAMLAILAASLAVIGSGYLDKLVVSSSQASVISGVTLYEK